MCHLHPSQVNFVARGDVLLLTLSRQRFEAAFGSLADLMAHHTSWRKWLAMQKDLVCRSAVLGPRYADVMTVSKGVGRQPPLAS